MKLSPTQIGAMKWLAEQPSLEGLGSVRSLLEAGSPSQSTCESLVKRNLVTRLGFARYAVTLVGRERLAET